MGQRARKQREKEIRKSDIIDAAQRLFLKKGFSETTMNDIAREAEFTKKTLYAYFRSKEEIFLSVHLRGLEKRWQLQQSTLMNVSTGYEMLYSLARGYYKFYTQYPEYLRLQMHWDMNGINFNLVGKEYSDEFVKMNQKAINTIIEAMKIGEKDGTLKHEDNKEFVISYFLYSMRSILNQIIVIRENISFEKKEEYFFYFVKYFLSALTPTQVL
ncbi:MAG: TetR/AcrR family transcriptional regulator [Candidatus Cloacimonetes bacterium]|nr:TetR/AcrR family transcriptional regulator [Candidatus Cloacimonadota bacterium]